MWGGGSVCIIKQLQQVLGSYSHERMCMHAACIQDNRCGYFVYAAYYCVLWGGEPM